MHSSAVTKNEPTKSFETALLLSSGVMRRKRLVLRILRHRKRRAQDERTVKSEMLHQNLPVHQAVAAMRRDILGYPVEEPDY